MTGKIPYYRVARKNGRAYWCPTERMKAAGFHNVALGDDGDEARETAKLWNEKWRTGAKYAEPRSGGSFLYFFEVDDRIKIGVSRRPFGRLQGLAGAAHTRFGRVVIVPGTRADEQRLHRNYSAYRTNGEWFKAASPVLVEMLQAARLGRVEPPRAQTGVKESNRAGLPESNQDRRP